MQHLARQAGFSARYDPDVQGVLRFEKDVSRTDRAARARSSNAEPILGRA